MNNDNFYTIQGWMINDLKLNSNELICYAVINGFSQDGKSLYMGSLAYLQKWMNVTQPTVIKALKSLVEKGLIIKHEVVENNVKSCYYQIDKRTKETLVGGTKETLVNNKKNNNKEKTSIDIDVKNDAEASAQSDEEKYFYNYLKENCPFVYKMQVPLTYAQYKKVCTKYSREKIWETLDAMNNWKELNKKRRYAYKTLLVWLEKDKKQYT